MFSYFFFFFVYIFKYLMNWMRNGKWKNVVYLKGKKNWCHFQFQRFNFSKCNKVKSVIVKQKWYILILSKKARKKKRSEWKVCCGSFQGQIYSILLLLIRCFISFCLFQLHSISLTNTFSIFFFHLFSRRVKGGNNQKKNYERTEKTRLI